MDDEYFDKLEKKAHAKLNRWLSEFKEECKGKGAIEINEIISKYIKKYEENYRFPFPQAMMLGAFLEAEEELEDDE